MGHGINIRKKRARRYAIIESKGLLTTDSAQTVYCQGDPRDSKWPQVKNEVALQIIGSAVKFSENHKCLEL